MLLRLAIRSLKFRKQSVLLTFIAMFLSLSVLFAVEHIRAQVKESFTRSISGVDLIIGPRTGDLTLLLSSVFHREVPSTAMTLDDLNAISKHRGVSWSVPVSLGDTHAGFTVVGTNTDFFEYFQTGDQVPLSFGSGRAFAASNEVVIGAQVAQSLHYQIGQSIVLAHGLGEVSFHHHEEDPLLIVGILAPTGTPVDHALYTSLQALAQAHDNRPKSLKRSTPYARSHTHIHGHDDEPMLVDVSLPDPNKPLLTMPANTDITSAFLGLNNPAAILSLQRTINRDTVRPLSAIIPGVTLNQLWQILRFVETTLQVITWLIVFATLLGLVTMLLASMRERQLEFAVFRSLGARPWQIFWLIQLEALTLAIFAILASMMLLSAIINLGGSSLALALGVSVSTTLLNNTLLMNIGWVLFSVILSTSIPAWKAYKNNLQSSLQR